MFGKERRCFNFVPPSLREQKKEENAKLVARQEKYIHNLELALMRIENKTYGVCCETGKLIPKERLRCVPITTRCLDAKLKKK